MENVALNIDQDVLIVTILDLENVANKTVSTERIGEVLDGLVVLLRSCLAKLTTEVVDDSGVSSTSLLLNRGDGEGVRDNFNESTVRTCGNNLIGFEPERQLSLLKDLVTCTDELHGKGLLSKIIIGLDDDSKELPRLEVLER